MTATSDDDVVREETLEHPMIDTSGTHTVVYYIGGKYCTGICEQESIFTTIKFLDDEGNEVQFVPGKTYSALRYCPQNRAQHLTERFSM